MCWDQLSIGGRGRRDGDGTFSVWNCSPEFGPSQNTHTLHTHTHIDMAVGFVVCVCVYILGNGIYLDVFT